jgi:L-fuconolactonase
MASRIVDIHPHVVSPDTTKYPHAPLGGKHSDWSATRPVDFEQMLVEMDEAGVDKAAIVHSSTTYGFDNSYVADCVARLPDRFTGVYAVDVLKPDAVEKIDFWRTRGMGGLRLFTGGATNQTKGSWLLEPSTFPVWEHCQDIGMSIVVQTTPDGLGMIAELATRFPRVRILLDHMARPVLEDGPPYAAAASLFALSKYGSVYLKITPRSFDLASGGKATPETFFKKLVAEFGANRLAFGSNYPASPGPLKMLVDQGHACFAALSDEDRAWIWARTAQSVYPELAD